MKTTLLAVGALALAGLTATAALAQQAGPAPRIERRVIAMSGPMDHGRPLDPAAQADRLRDLLQLRPDQEGPLRAFLDGTRPPERDGPPARPNLEAMTTPERLDFMADRMAEHAARFKQRADVTKRFYAALTPAQRKAFEAAHIGEGPMGHPGMRFERRIERFGGPGDMSPPEFMGPPPPEPPEAPAPPAGR